MKILKSIIESFKEPAPQSLWLNNGELKFFGSKGWTLINDDSEDRQELEEKVDSLDKEMGKVKQDLATLDSNQDIIELQIGNTEDVKASNLEKLKSMQNNDHTFFADINYGYGTASWLPSTGGSALIITNDGHAVKYTIATDGGLTKGNEFTLKDYTYTLPTASSSVLGGVKIGANITITNGVISTTAQQQVDWNATTGIKSIANKPTNLATDKELSDGLATKVDKVTGKGLSTNDYTTAEKTKLAGLSNYSLPTASANTLGGVKIGSGLTITNGVLSANGVSVDLTPYAKKTDLSSYATTTALGDKVDKVEGKGLSTNDFTADYKTKLDGIASGANKSVVMTAATADAAGTSGLVPAPAAGKQGSYLRGDGTWTVPTDTKYTLPAATKAALGGVKAGTNIADLATDATLATVVGAVNTLLAQLRAAGVLVS